MHKRYIRFGDYTTSVDGWTLCAWQLSAPVYRSERITVPGRDGDLDLSGALTDGDVCYNDRTLTATLELSEHTRMHREQIISEMTNKLDGRTVQIVLPDDPLHYLSGRCHVERLYNDWAHASVRISAVCAPWRYDCTEIVRYFTLSLAPQQVYLINNGRMRLAPTFTVDDVAGVITDFYEFENIGPGVHRFPGIMLHPGANRFVFAGFGNLTVSYRQAFL